jgi:hypothetical protein
MNGDSKLRRVKVLFDETHNESWSTSREKAMEISPDYPEYSSYAAAAGLLKERGFLVERNLHHTLTRDRLEGVDILALVHPCDPRWERTVSQNSPQLSPEEIRDIQDFVRRGGALLVITEYEHDKYGDNLNELLEPFGLTIRNGTVLDRIRCANRNPTWVLSEASGSPLSRSLTTGVSTVCFYQAGYIAVSGSAEIVLQASAQAHPARAGLLGASQAEDGRVLLVTDSLLFGDDYLTDPNHQALWMNCFQWLAVPRFQRNNLPKPPSEAARSDPWKSVRESVNGLRLLQQPDGSVPASFHETASKLTEQILGHLPELDPFFPHQKEYLEQLPEDLERWRSEGYRKPDFQKSLSAFHPERHRQDQIEHFVLFPLYTPNASLQTRFETMIMRMPWPDWLARLERERYPNAKFAPGHLVDHTRGYESECAVLFPETIAVAGKSPNHFATIFCDREALRLQRYAKQAIEAVSLPTPPNLECLLSSLPTLEDTVALWDLIHDRSHSLGELPFDPFMIRQRAPFWMYALEELRVDLRSFSEAHHLAKEGFHLAEYVPYAILLDRLFRFPIVGSRIKNYDGLAGQLLFAFLHEKDVLQWCDNAVGIAWEQLPSAIEELRREIASLYRLGATCSKLTFWIEAHDLITKYVRPNVASRWKREGRLIDNEADPAKWIGLVENDEFPLGSFHSNLRRRIGEA